MRRRIATWGGIGLLLASSLGIAGCASHNSSASGGDHNSSTASAGATLTTDGAFVQLMAPHHRSAIDMAAFAATKSDRAEIKRLAASISTSQEKEITELRAIGSRLGVTVDDAGGHGANHNGTVAAEKQLGLTTEEAGMMMDASALNNAKEFDREFIDMMIPHHQGAIRMARAVIARGSDADTKKLAEAIIAAQSAEIEQMNAWRTDWFGAPSPLGGVPPA